MFCGKKVNMIIALTGTPGTGKTLVGQTLKKQGYRVVDLNKLAVEKNFVVGVDEERQSKIVDTEKLDRYVREKFSNEKLTILEGHLSHLLGSVDKIIILRCHPRVLKKRLFNKGWSGKKIDENVESEILDIILCETLEKHPGEHVFEIDTTHRSTDGVAECVKEIIEEDFKDKTKYKIGKVDWSDEILK